MPEECEDHFRNKEWIFYPTVTDCEIRDTNLRSAIHELQRRLKDLETVLVKETI